MILTNSERFWHEQSRPQRSRKTERTRVSHEAGEPKVADGRLQRARAPPEEDVGGRQVAVQQGGADVMVHVSQPASHPLHDVHALLPRENGAHLAQALQNGRKSLY
jgi:hypothetical protein